MKDKVLLTAICLMLAVPSCNAGRVVERASISGNNAPLLKHLVWAHSMMSYPLDLNAPHTKDFGAAYPLDQEVGLQERIHENWQYQDIRRAKESGLDGFALDVFNTPEFAEPYLVSADKLDFLICMCLDLSSVPPDQKEDKAFQIVSQYCDLAAKHSSAARVDGAFLIETYGTEQLPIPAWERVRNRLKSKGYSTYWVVSVDTDRKLLRSSEFPATKLAQYFGPFESGYLFGDAGPHWNNVVSLFASMKRPFMGGVKPGYFRYRGRLTIDPQGTARYRREWKRDIDSRIPWNTVITWNDMEENTGIIPSGDWNFTRSDLTAWYSALFKKKPLPFTDARLYVTVPKSVYPGEDLLAEALILNPLDRSLTARIQIVDGEGTALGKSVTVDIPAGIAGSANATLRIPENWAGRFIRARAEMLDGGRITSTVLSAPTVIPDFNTQPGYGAVDYSIPAKHQLLGKVGVRLIPSATNGGPTRAIADIPPGISPRFIEILHNTASSSNIRDGRPAAIPIPARDKSGRIVGRTTWGFYVARITDQNMNVGYSDPIYVAPPAADLTLRENYDFGQTDGNKITDASPFGNVATMRSVQKVPDTLKQPGFLSFDGKTSCVDLVPSVTPDGPMAISARVRPNAYDGCVFADTGGLLISLSSDGRVVYSRLAGQKWVAVTSDAAIPMSTWSDIVCSWDGNRCRIYVNGKLTGEHDCSPGFSSYRRSIGCNPAAAIGGGQYFTGDVASFQIKLLPK